MRYDEELRELSETVSSVKWELSEMTHYVWQIAIVFCLLHNRNWLHNNVYGPAKQ